MHALQIATFKSNIWKLYLFELLGSLHFFGAILVPFYTDWAHISYQQIFFLQAWFMFWVFALEIPTGTFADKFGRKFSMGLGVIINAAAALVYIAAPKFEYFLLAEFMWALAAAFMSGADEAILYDSLKASNQENQSKKIFTRIGSLGMLGIMIASPIGSLLVASFGYTIPYVATAATMLAAGVVAFFLVEPPSSERKKKPSYQQIMREGIGYIKDHKILKILAADMIGIATIAYFMIWLFQPLLKEAGVEIGYFGIVHAPLAGFQILLLNTYLPIEKILGKKKRLLFYTSLATGVFFIISGITTNVWVLLVAIVVGGGIGLSRKTLYQSYLQKYIPSDKRATITSGINMLRTLAIVIANLIVGALAQWSVHNTMIILGAAAIGLALISNVEEEHLID